MRRLCTESSRSYPGRSVPRAVRAARGVELRPCPERAGNAIEPYGGCGRHGSRTEDPRESNGYTTGPYRDSGSAPDGNVRRDGTEVSRRHSSPTPAVMGGDKVKARTFGNERDGRVSTVVTHPTG